MKSTAQGNKLYRCGYAGCKKEYRSRTGRRSHEEVEHEGKKHDCDKPGCMKKYKFLSALVSHKRAKHDKIKFRCNYPDCTKEFESRNGRNIHRDRDHTPLANAEEQESLLSTPGNGALSRGARRQRDQPRQPRQAAATILNPPAATSSHELLTLASAPEAEDGGQRQDPRDEPVRQMLSEAESGVRPHHQPQQVAENTNHGSISFILNSPATITSDHSLHPLADIPIDPMLKDPQAPTSPTCIGGMPQPPAKTMPSSIRTHIVEPRYYCGECGKEYQREDNLRDHAQQHLAPRKGGVYGCNNRDCGKPCFESWEGLKAHVCSSPMPKPYECIKCRQGFRRSTSALRHPGLCRFNIAPSRTNTANHDLQKTRTACFCGHCDGIFLNPSRLQGHVWGHCDETRVQCCGRHFVDVRRLRAHQQENGCAEVDLNRPPRMFINSKIFGCCVDRCGLRFPDVKKLRSHMSIHRNCPSCGRNFQTNPALTRHMRFCGEPENNEDLPPGAEPQYQLQQAAMRILRQVLNAQPAGEDAPALGSQASLTSSGEVSWIYTPNELKYSKKASAMASVPAATDPRSLTTGSGMTLGGEDEEAGSPAPSYPDGIQSPGSRASWPGRYGSSIHVLDDLPDHLRNDSPMADPPETGFSDEDDARSCTTLAGEEDRRSLTPAPVSGRPFRRAHKQEPKHDLTT